VAPETLLLGVDGGGTQCRARLCTPDGRKLGEAVDGPANIRLGLDQSLNAVVQTVRQCLLQAGLPPQDLKRITACLALAGASEPSHLAAAQARKYPFGHVTITTDARAACVGAHGGRPGGVIIVGTGTIGWAEPGSRRVGGWGMPISDEGSGAWIGAEALRHVLWAYDGRISWTSLLNAVFDQFNRDPHAIVRFASAALPRDFGTLAPLVVDHAKQGDPVGVELMQAAAVHIDHLAERLAAHGVQKLVLVGGLATPMMEWISPTTRARLVPPKGDALDGALQLARAAAEALAA
jgi:glucosamine kinase